MYAWKCWRDSRDRVILYAAASLAIGIMVGAMIFESYRRSLASEWVWRARNINWNPALWAWQWGMDSLNVYLPPAALWAALSLAAVSVGREYGSGAMPFLLTRPASRKRFVWTDYGLGLTQTTAILVMMLLGALPFFAYTSRAYVGWSWTLVPGNLVLAAALYGLTHFLTALMGSSTKGLSAAGAAVLIYLLLPGALDEWWHFSAPLRFKNWSLNILEWDWRLSDSRFLLHGWPVLMWLLVALAFPLLSQFILERKEV